MRAEETQVFFSKMSEIDAEADYGFGPYSAKFGADESYNLACVRKISQRLPSGKFDRT